MLTVKVVHPGIGREFVVEVSAVQKRPAGESASGFPCVSYWRTKDGICEDIFQGIVYVMNELGKTIAVYELLFPVEA
jgi:hypothetical protein